MDFLPHVGQIQLHRVAYETQVRLLDRIARDLAAGAAPYKTDEMSELRTGAPVQGVSVQVVDDDGNPVPPGTMRMSPKGNDAPTADLGSPPLTSRSGRRASNYQGWGLRNAAERFSSSIAATRITPSR